MLSLSRKVISVLIIIMNKLKKILKDKGLKQNWIAEQLGLTREAVSHWVTGKNNPTTENLKRVANLLNIKLDEIFFDIDISITENDNNNKNKTKESGKVK